MSILKSLSNHFKYYAACALAEDGPQQAVREELSRQGWSFKPSLTQEEFQRAVCASVLDGAVGQIPQNRTKIMNKDGVDIFSAAGTAEQRREYKAAVRAAAAKVYQINP